MSEGETVFSDRKWVIVAIISLLGVIIPVALAVMQRDTKTFTSQVVSKTVLLDLHDPVLDQVKAYSQGKEITRLTVWTLKLTNSGSSPIRREDFDSPITLAIPGEVSLLRSLVTDSIPPGFRPEVTQVGSVVSVQPALC